MLSAASFAPCSSSNGSDESVERRFGFCSYSIKIKEVERVKLLGTPNSVPVVVLNVICV